MCSLPQNHGTVTIQINVRGAYCSHGSGGKRGWPWTERRGEGVPGGAGGAPVGLHARVGLLGSWEASPRPSPGSCAPGPCRRPRGVRPHPGDPLPWASELLTTSPTQAGLSFLPRILSRIGVTETPQQGVCVCTGARVCCAVRVCVLSKHVILILIRTVEN